MQKRLALIFTILTLTSGCSIFQIHKTDIQQGNIITPAMIAHLHPGMTKADVKNLMGTPVLVNTFNDNREDYIYTFTPGHGKTTEKNMVLIFRNNRLSEIGGNY